eukprot:PhM_4_TR14228/c0_g1_i1/m.91147
MSDVVPTIRWERHSNSSNNIDSAVPPPPLNATTSGRHLPPPRSFHTSVITATDLVVCCGRNASEVLCDAFMFNLATRTWRELPAPRQARAYHVSVHDARRNRVLLHGGKDFTPTYFDDIAAFDLATHTWSDVRQVNPPGPRGYHTAAMSGDDEMVCVGGHNCMMWFDVASLFNLVTGMWRHIAMEFVPPNVRRHRCECMHAACQARSVCNQCGGVSMCLHLSPTQRRQQECFATNCGLRIENYRCRKDKRRAGLPMPPRDGHTMCDVDGSLVVFGGELSKSFYDTAFALSSTDQTWTTVAGNGEYREPPPHGRCPRHQGPGHRGYHSAWGDASGLLCVWGGYLHVGSFFNDLHCLDVATGEWFRGVQEGTVPQPRASSTTTTSVHHPGLVVLFGGDDGDVYYNDVYVGEFSTVRSLRYLIGRTLSETPVRLIEGDGDSDDDDGARSGEQQPGTPRSAIEALRRKYMLKMGLSPAK